MEVTQASDRVDSELQCKTVPPRYLASLRWLFYLLSSANVIEERGTKIMRRKLLANGLVSALVVMVVLGAATPARASQLFAFNYSLPGAGATPMAVSASGLFATTDLAGSSYTIIGAWGAWNGTAITGVSAPGTFGGNDNLLFSSNRSEERRVG